MSNLFYSPIVIFAFNRLEPLKACVNALLSNSEAKNSDLIVFVDGPRMSIDNEVKKVKSVREYVMNITGFKSLTYHFSDINKKLGPSIIAGVTKVLNEYDSAIIIEDDIIVGKNYLSFMNQCLDLYKNNNEVFSVCGYSIKIKIPTNYFYDIYFGPRSNSWGWATWKDRWQECDWQLDDWDSVKKNSYAFNKWGGSNCFSLLNRWKEGKNQSWAIRFCYNQFIHKAYTVFPIKSHVDNRGFDGNGTNCKKFNRYRFEFDSTSEKTFKLPPSVVLNEKIIRQRLWYNSLLMRAYSKIMNILYTFFT